MSVQSRRWLVAVAIVVAGSAVADILLLDAAGRSSRGLATSWAASLSGSDRNEAAGRIETFPGEYQQALMGSMTPDELSQMWQRRAEAFVRLRPNLAPGQLALISEARALLGPAAFGPEGSNPESLMARRVLANKLGDALGPDSDYLLLRNGTFGRGGSVSSLSARVRAQQYLLDVVSVIADVGDCTCDSVDSYACLGYPEGYICSELTGCTPRPYTCGLFNACNGVCVNPLLPQ